MLSGIPDRNRRPIHAQPHVGAVENVVANRAGSDAGKRILRELRELHAIDAQCRLHPRDELLDLVADPRAVEAGHRGFARQGSGPRGQTGANVIVAAQRSSGAFDR
jgi:hypothetical protein